MRQRETHRGKFRKEALKNMHTPILCGMRHQTVRNPTRVGVGVHPEKALLEQQDEEAQPRQPGDPRMAGSGRGI